MSIKNIYFYHYLVYATTIPLESNTKFQTLQNIIYISPVQLGINLSRF